MSKPDPEHMQKTAPWWKTIVLMLAPVLAFFALAEAAARVWEVWRPPLSEDIGQGFTEKSRLFVPDPADSGRMITSPTKTASFHDQHFDMPKPAGTFRIFALGESSVNYLDYEFSIMPERLSGELPGAPNVEILNCGGLSYGSHRIQLIAAEILQYDPDLVLLYCGHNEFEELEQLSLAHLELAPFQQVLNKSALYRFVRDLIARRQIRNIEEDKNRRNLAESIPDTSKSWGHVFTQEEKDERMAAFRRNLERIILLCREHKVPLIMGSIPSNLMRPTLADDDGRAYEEQVLPLFRDGRYEEGRAKAQEILKRATRHQSSDLENGVIRELAAQYGVPLADVEAAIIAAEPHGIPGEALFNDHCHLNPEGNRILIQQYEEQILRLFPR